MNMSFDEIPQTLRVPLVYIEISEDEATDTAVRPYRCLIIGQMFEAGTATPNAMIRVTRPEHGATYFGAGSMAAQMVEAWCANNTITEVYACGLLDNAAGAAALGALTFAGPATAAGTLNLYLGGTRVQAGIMVGQTAAETATAVVAAIAAHAALPVTAAVDGVDTGKVNLTARHKGECANDIDIRINHYKGEATPAGLTVVITAMTGGTANPDLAPVIAAMAPSQYHIIACPYTDAYNLTQLEAELSDRFGPLEMREGLAITAARAGHSDLGVLGDSRNSPFLTIIHAAGIPQSPWQMAAATAAVVAYYGNIDPARPMHTLALQGIIAPREEELFSLSENNLLLWDGISTWMVDGGGVVRLQRVISTYKTNEAGGADESYLDIGTLLTLGYLRWDWRNYILGRYPRHKLGDDDIAYAPGQKIMTPSLARAEAIAWFHRHEGNALVQGFERFKAGLLVQRDATVRSRLNVFMPPGIVSGLQILATRFGFWL